MDADEKWVRRSRVSGQPRKGPANQCRVRNPCVTNEGENEAGRLRPWRQVGLAGQCRHTTCIQYQVAMPDVGSGCLTWIWIFDLTVLRRLGAALEYCEGDGEQRCCGILEELCSTGDSITKSCSICWDLNMKKEDVGGQEEPLDPPQTQSTSQVQKHSTCKQRGHVESDCPIDCVSLCTVRIACRGYHAFHGLSKG